MSPKSMGIVPSMCRLCPFILNMIGNVVFYLFNFMSDLSFLQGLSLPPHLHRKDAIFLTSSWDRVMKFGSSIETCLTVPQFKVEPFRTILRVSFWFFPMTTDYFSDFLCFHVFLTPLFLNPSNCALENCTKPAQYTLISYWGQGSLPLKKSSFFMVFSILFWGGSKFLLQKLGKNSANLDRYWAFSKQ